MGKIIDIAFSGFWQFVGVAILLALVCDFGYKVVTRVLYSIDARKGIPQYVEPVDPDLDD